MNPLRVAGGARADAKVGCGRMGGFTLIELMIVVAVVAILAAIAMPSYSQYVRKARRAQAEADLVEYAQAAERFHTINNSYAGFALSTTQSPRETTSAAQYKVELKPAPAQSTFTITATPANENQEKDPCGTLSLNQAGTKLHSTGTDAECLFGTTGP